MALCCGCTGRFLCNHRVHCNDEVVDSDQEGPAGRERERKDRREESAFVGWDPQSAVVASNIRVLLNIGEQAPLQISCGRFTMTGNSAARRQFPVMVKRPHDTSN